MSDVHVLKFGGTSVAGPARVRLAARRVAAHVYRGRRVVVVVSAAGSSTDGLLQRLDRLRSPSGPPRSTTSRPPLRLAAHGRDMAFCRDAGHDPDADPTGGCAREVDRLLATGEDRSAALLAAALWQVGVPARSLRGGEAGIFAHGSFGAGSIQTVVTDRLRLLAGDGVVPVVSGFQAVRPDGETVTLGRGGSDTSAVAIAAALDAQCHIITDVDAVYDRDPRCEPGATPLPRLTHAELLRLVESGAQVVHPAAAQLALEANVPLRVYHFRAPLHARGTVVPADPSRRTRSTGATLERQTTPLGEYRERLTAGGAT